MLKQLKKSAIMLLLFTVLTGLLYPLAVTAVSQVVFPAKANGSLIERDGKVVGSELIGQPFDDPKYFWGRPSATGPFPYNAASSSGSNLAATNPNQISAIADRVKKLREADVPENVAIPVDLVTASGSGLDPHISVAAAEVQIARVAKARVMNEAEVRTLVDQNTEPRQFGIFGEPRVNVLKLNLSLDERPSDVSY